MSSDPRPFGASPLGRPARAVRIRRRSDAIPARRGRRPARAGPSHGGTRLAGDQDAEPKDPLVPRVLSPRKMEGQCKW